MADVIFDPLEEFDKKYKAAHAENAKIFFDALVKRSGIDIEKNRETVRLYNECKDSFSSFGKKLDRLRFLRVVMCITIILIPLVILKITPMIRSIRAETEEANKRSEKLLEKANKQMRSLNSLFTDRDALDIIGSTIPLILFEKGFSARQEADMRINYDFSEHDDEMQSTVDALSGSYNENPFLFENKMVHTMGTEIYHGQKIISWTEAYRDSNGNLKKKKRSQVLRASVEKPKPCYNTQVVLNYCSQGGSDLSFFRDASHLEQKSEREIERFIKSGEKKIKEKTDDAIRQNGSFTGMSNSKFEVLFDALDRTNEVQFRTLFTPLAQKNMISLIRSNIGYGDDFNFKKSKRTNTIVSEHSQGRDINLTPGNYVSYSYDITREKFMNKNIEFFKAVYFDLAPILAIPIYQERPVHSLKPILSDGRRYSLKEYEALANAANSRYIVHPCTKTRAIIKSSFIRSDGEADEACITAYSYDIEKRVDFVSVYGGDGHYHDVPVEWDEYIPLEKCNHFYISANESAEERNVIARHNGLCIFNY